MGWTNICGTSDVPENTLKPFDIHGIPVVIANYGGKFRVMPPICPHMEEPLCESGVIANGILTCTKHLWAWDLASLGMIGETEKPLKTYEAKAEDGRVMALIDQELLYDFEEEDDMDDDFFSKS